MACKGPQRSRLRGLLGALFDPGEGDGDTSVAAANSCEVALTPGSSAQLRRSVPWSLRVASAWGWRLITLAVLGYGLVILFKDLKVIVIPVLVALLLAVLLEPLLRFLMRYLHFPRTLAAAVSLLVGIAVVFGLMGLASSQIIRNTGQLIDKAGAGVETMVRWLVDGPLKLDADAVYRVWNQVQTQIIHFVEDNTNALASSAFATISQIGSFLTGFLMCLFCVFFFLKDGRRMWQWVLRLLPVPARSPLNEAAIRGWVTLGAYARTQALVAAIDACGIGLGAALLGVPMAIPIGVLVFFASFIPIVGAIFTGVIAVAVAVVTNGPATAFAMLVVILAVQQIESNLLQPFLMSSAVSLHPVAVLLVVAGGAYLDGIVGAVFSVPILAFVNTAVLYLRGYDKFLRLRYQHDRPGGPPGCLEAEMRRSAQPDKNNLKAARKARAQAIAQGHDVPADGLGAAGPDEAPGGDAGAGKDGEAVGSSEGCAEGGETQGAAG